MKIMLDNVLKEKGISQYRLSKLTGIFPSTINNLCNNKTSQITFSNLEKICIALDCTPNDIFLIEK